MSERSEKIEAVLVGQSKMTSRGQITVPKEVRKKFELFEEKPTLQRKRAVINECADVANFVMMIADNIKDESCFKSLHHHQNRFMVE